MAQACARLCHQRRHLLNDVGGNGESGESVLFVLVINVLILATAVLEKHPWDVKFLLSNCFSLDYSFK